MNIKLVSGKIIKLWTKLYTYFMAISVDKASSTLNLCFGRSSSRTGLSVKKVKFAFIIHIHDI